MLVSFSLIYQTFISSLPSKKSDYEYVWIPEWIIPEDIMEEYNIKPLIQNGRVLSECKTCIYGLPQEGLFPYIKLVNTLLITVIYPQDTHQDFFVTSHDQQHSILLSTTLALFFFGKHNADHLINTL